MGIDLDALANDLRAAGADVTFSPETGSLIGPLLFWSGPGSSGGSFALHDGFVTMNVTVDMLAIIARHLGAGQPVAVTGETLYRRCPDIRESCPVCHGHGYVPVASPEPLSAEEFNRIARWFANQGFFDEQGPWRYEQDPAEFDDLARAVLAALPARFAVPVEGA